MNQRINNSYLYHMFLTYKQEKWFQVEFFFSFFVVIIQTAIYGILFQNIFVSHEVDAVSMTLYYAVVNVVSLSMLPAQFAAWNHQKKIHSGEIVMKLLRPVSFPLTEFLECLTQFMIKSTLNVIIILAIEIVINRKADILWFLLGILSLYLGFAILYFIQGIIGCLAAWFGDVLRLRDVFMSFLFILGGKVLPSRYLFGALKKVIYYTLIPCIYDIPTGFFLETGNLKGVLLQMIWLTVLLSIYAVTFQVMKHHLDYGG